MQEKIKEFIKEADNLYYQLYELKKLKNSKFEEETEELLLDLLDSLNSSAMRVREFI